MMHMTIYWSKNVTLLLKSWESDSWPTYLLSLLACFLASLLHQYIEHRRLTIRPSVAAKPSQPSIATPFLSKPFYGSDRLGSAALFAIGSALAYLLMLAVMSFNGGVMVAVVSGLSVGFFLFRSGGDQIVAVDFDDGPCCSCS